MAEGDLGAAAAERGDACARFTGRRLARSPARASAPRIGRPTCAAAGAAASAFLGDLARVGVEAACAVGLLEATLRSLEVEVYVGSMGLGVQWDPVNWE